MNAQSTSRSPLADLESLLKTYWRLLAQYFWPQWVRVLLLAALLLGTILLQLLNPQILRQFIDQVAQNASAAHPAPANELVRIGLLFFGVAVAQQILGVVSAYMSENVGWVATNALRLDLADHALRLDMSFHNARTPGEMIERIDGDVGALSQFFSLFVLRVFKNSLLLAGTLVLLFREDWRIGVGLLAFTLVALYILWRLKNVAVPHWRAVRQFTADLYGFLEERIAGREDIRACGAKAYVMDRFYRLMRALLEKSLKAGVMNNILLNSTQLLFAIGNGLALLLSAWLYQRQALTLGGVYLVFQYSTMLAAPVQALTLEIQNLQWVGGSVERVREIFQIQSKVPANVSEPLPASLAGTGQPPPEHPALGVVFQDVSFNYTPVVAPAKRNGQRGGLPADFRSWPENGRASVLEGLSFRLQAGKTLGLLGRTGSGKTTLARLLFRLYDPDQGSICLGSNGTLADIRHLPLAELRQRIGLVTQNVQLFNASVYDNLTFFDRRIPAGQILQVLNELGLGEWYRALPQGLDTVLAPAGAGLSAGEAQLLAFARIFLQNPGLVILDEASSRLDPATEHRIERSVERLVQNRTAILIAHRLGTVQRVDEILIMDSGRIVEHGERAALASDPSSRFYGLLQTGLEEVLA